MAASVAALPVQERARCRRRDRRSLEGAQGRTDVRVVGQGGDGGTLDIGFACLSGMFERNDDVLYVCYDNEAYMNTGVQRSSATPPAARTAHEPVRRRAGERIRAGQERAAHRDGTRIPYVATATVADLHDLERKVERAEPVARATSTCSFRALGWGAASRDTITLARLAHGRRSSPCWRPSRATS